MMNRSRKHARCRAAWTFGGEGGWKIVAKERCVQHVRTGPKPRQMLAFGCACMASEGPSLGPISASLKYRRDAWTEIHSLLVCS
jgi:hypothetical protein